jgi:hypothetical protein
MVLGMPNLTARLSENYHRFNVLIFRAAQSRLLRVAEFEQDEHDVWHAASVLIQCV